MRMLAPLRSAPELPTTAAPTLVDLERQEPLRRAPLPSGTTGYAPAKAAKRPAQATPACWRWLGGLIDGDGHLDPAGQRLEISGHRGELPTLGRVRRLLGGADGWGLSSTSPNGVQLRLGSRAVRRLLVERVSPHVHHSSKRDRLRHFARRLGLEPPPAESPDVRWASGALQSDGHIGLELRWRPKGGFYYLQPDIHFTNTNRPLVEAVANALPGLGNLYGPYSNPPGQPIHRWRLTSAEQLVELGRLLLTTPLEGPKRRRLWLLVHLLLPLQRLGANRPSHSAHRDWQRALTLWAHTVGGSSPWERQLR